MNKHTAGPWIFETWDYRIAKPSRMELSIQNKTNRIAVVDWDQGKDNPYTIQNDEAFANARLIAAAPDMLEALDTLTIYAESIMERVKFYNMCEFTGIYSASMPELDAAIKAAKAAIQKAEGT
jgi:hypothetical protein